MMCPRRRSANPGIGLYLLFSSRESSRGVPRSNSTTFTPLSQCSVIATEDDTCAVPFAYGTETLAGVRGDDVVQPAGEMCRDLVVGMEHVVEYLILEAERGVVCGVRERELLRDVVLHAAVGTGCHAPLEGELEVSKGVDRHEVAAGGGLPVRLSRDLRARDLDDRAVDHAPMRGRDAVVAESAPPRQGSPIEEKP